MFSAVIKVRVCAVGKVGEVFLGVGRIVVVIVSCFSS